MNIYERICSDVYKHSYPEAVQGIIEDLNEWKSNSPEQALESKIKTESPDWNGSSSVILVDIDSTHEEALSPALKSSLYFSPNQNIHIHITAVTGSHYWTREVKHQVRFKIYTYEQIPETLIVKFGGSTNLGSLMTLPPELATYADTIATIETHETTPNGTIILGLLVDETDS